MLFIGQAGSKLRRSKPVGNAYEKTSHRYLCLTERHSLIEAPGAASHGGISAALRRRKTRVPG
jgi:hypothetical protein